MGKGAGHAIVAGCLAAVNPALGGLYLGGLLAAKAAGVALPKIGGALAERGRRREYRKREAADRRAAALKEKHRHKEELLAQRYAARRAKASAPKKQPPPQRVC